MKIKKIIQFMKVLSQIEREGVNQMVIAISSAIQGRKEEEEEIKRNKKKKEKIIIINRSKGLTENWRTFGLSKRSQKLFCQPKKDKQKHKNTKRGTLVKKVCSKSHSVQGFTLINRGPIKW